MSLYNMVHGTNRDAPLVLALLDREPGDFGRFRDAWVERSAEGGIRLVVYTRSGGGNRTHSDEDAEPGPRCGCSGCTMTHVVPTHPLYLEDRDDDRDPSYATIYFRVPDDAEATLEALGAPEGFVLASLAIDPPDMRARWAAALAALGRPALAALGRPEGGGT